MALPKLNQLRSRERWGLGVAVLSLVVLGIDQLVVTTVRARLQTLDEAIAAETVAIDHQVKVLSARGVIAAEYERVGGRLAADLSSAEAIDVIKGEIDDLARASGVVLVSMEHRAPVADPEAALTEYLIDIRKFESDMAQLLTFLGKLWGSPGMLRVRNLSIRPAGGGDGIEGSLVISKVLVGDV